MISFTPIHDSTFSISYFTGFKNEDVLSCGVSWLCQLVFPVPDRSARLKEMQERQEELQLNNKRLQQEEQHLREKYHEVT